jgi:hypothetical protein
MRRDPFVAFAALGIPDACHAVARILASPRLRPRMQWALILYLEGLSAREAAKALGLRDHMSLWRRARAYGLQPIHAQRQAFRQSMQWAAEASAITARGRGNQAGAMELAKATSLATDALLTLERLDRRLL